MNSIQQLRYYSILEELFLKYIKIDELNTAVKLLTNNKNHDNHFHCQKFIFKLFLPLCLLEAGKHFSSLKISAVFLHLNKINDLRL